MNELNQGVVMEKSSNTLSQKQNFNRQDLRQDIILIHGLWMTPLSWENWKKRFSEHGYNVMTPGWPGVENKSVEEIRSHPDRLRGIGLNEIVSHYEKIIRSLEKPPILMGHSIGGLIVQMLLNKGLGCAGVGIAAGQTKGVLTLPYSTIRTAWNALKNPFNTNGIVELTYEQFKYSFTNGLPEEVSRMAYDKFYIPGPTRPLIQAGFANFNPNALSKVDYKSDKRAPLLFVAGGKDHVVPASVNKENAFKYQTLTVTDYREFHERTHFTVGQEGWEDIADFCLNWAVNEAVEFESNILH
jgi:pimeloyl-ACP methyl ester carboxylesterase